MRKTVNRGISRRAFIPGSAPVGHLVKSKQNFSGEMIIGEDLVQIGVGKVSSGKSGMT